MKLIKIAITAELINDGTQVGVIEDIRIQFKQLIDDEVKRGSIKFISMQTDIEETE